MNDTENMMPRDFKVPSLIARAGEQYSLAFTAGGLAMLGCVNTRVKHVVDELKAGGEFDAGDVLLKIIREIGALQEQLADHD